MLEACVGCLKRQTTTICEMAGMAEKNDEAQAVVSDIIAAFPIDDTLPDACRAMGRIWSELCREGGLLPADPYKPTRDLYNDLIASHVDEVRAAIAASDEPVTMALKYAAGGNLIDFGANVGFDPSAIGPLLASIPSLSFTLDDSAALLARLKTARTLVILSDNCGELLLDKVLIETLASAYPALSITYLMRQNPILNDSQVQDALFFGLDEHARVQGNSDPAHVPGTLLDLFDAPTRELVTSADVVIAKGMGNFETTRDENLPNEWFLFMNKCADLKPWMDCELKSLVCMGPRNTGGTQQVY